jgi:hypothetical protein
MISDAGGARSFVLFCLLKLSPVPTLEYINQPKASISTDVFHMVIVINNPVNRTAKCAKENIGTGGKI